ncbi:hypothetical protein BDK51DRAFT_49308 [Blyttiomyces helicus]|uniref:Uncharacterized protein n=1 Tax=Blyttiomyces helicus TaxID=388810 RepID=A0A4P9VVW9_9FUNG|nr:hypothetical protein BDK51DRAFT_49308 [Blyttiomyces helicus]|eukprot:RKO83821.1 hypothetical protein BDK51DRAFT_49308 [Blyttiomyces helicus]
MTLKERSQAENLANDLRQKIAEYKSSAKTSSELIQTLRQKIINGEKDVSERLRVAREEEWEKMSRVEAEKSELEKQLSALKQRTVEAEANEEASRKDVQMEIARLKKEARDAANVAESLTTKNQSLLVELDKVNGDVQTLERRMAESVEAGKSAERELEGFRREEGVLRDKLETVKLSLQSTASELAQTRDHMDKERQVFEHNTERMRSTWSREQAALQQRLETLERENRELGDKVQHLDDILEKQQRLFKTKMVQLKSRIKESREESVGLKYVVGVGVEWGCGGAGGVCDGLRGG